MADPATVRDDDGLTASPSPRCISMQEVARALCAHNPDGPLTRWLRDPGRFTTSAVHHVQQFLVAVTHVVVPIAAAALIVVVLGRFLVWLHTRRGGGDAHVLAILPPPEVDPDAALAFWTGLHGLLRVGWRAMFVGRPHVAFELAASGGQVRFGLWLPGSVPPARVGLADREWFPLATDHPVDPARFLLGHLAGLGHADAAVVQVLARPAAGRRLRGCRHAATALRSGRPTSRAARFIEFWRTPSPARPRPSDDPFRAADVKAILTKASGPGWEGVVRYGVAGPGSGRRERRRLRAGAHGVTAAFAIHDGRNRLRRRRLARPARSLAARHLGRGDLLSAPELAALAHLPTDVVGPGVVRAGARSVTPPPGVPTKGKVLGDAEGGERRPVAIEVADARHHLHLLGATGVGKSTLLTNLVLGDVTAGRGAVVIDPKGDLVADILDRLPERAIGRTVVLDPDDDAAPPALNVLDGSDRHLAVDHLVGIFRRLFEAYWGPRTDDVLRVAALTLVARDGSTLADVPRLLTEPAFRTACTRGLSDRLLVGFWDWYDALSPAGQSQVVGPVMNKLRGVLTRPYVAAVLGSARSSFDLGADVLDGGLLLARLPKGTLGEDTARLLGSLVVARVWQAVTARARAGQSARVDASLYVDECQNFLTLPGSLGDMLAEARGYRLSVVAAHQHLGQLPHELRDAVSANARNKVFFALSPEDARALQRHMAPNLAEHDLSHLGGYQAAARLVVGGQDTPAFTLRTRPAPEPVPGRADAVRAAARERFGRDHDARRAEALWRNLAGRQARPPGTSVGASPGTSAGRSVGVLDLPGSNGAFGHVDGPNTPADGEADSWSEA